MTSDRSCWLSADVDTEAEAEAEAVALCERVNGRFGGAGRLGAGRGAVDCDRDELPVERLLSFLFGGFDDCVIDSLTMTAP